MAGVKESLLAEAKANTHLTHLEELVLTQGPKGYRLARAFLLELLETLKGNTEPRVQTSVKWDGAPAIFAGINPENGKFFVGTKSIFNKEPKINYTKEDVRRNHGHAPGLVDKLEKALDYLPSLGINKILQGDFMFDDEMLEIVEIDGEPHYRFKPNTIVYAVPVDSELGEEVGKSKFGIVFHTTYDSLDSGASYGADVRNLNRPPGVWFDDAFFTDDTGYVTLTEEEESRVKGLVEEADSINERINYNDLPSDLLNIYINKEIRAGQFLKDPRQSYQGFIKWYTTRMEKKVDSLKTEKGRMRTFGQGEEQLKIIETKKEDILNLFRVSRRLFEAKNIFINKYNNAVYNTKHFVDDGSGDLKVTNPEGYVAVDHAGNGVKFVDRLEFSRANFAMDKGFKKEPSGVNELKMFEVFWGDEGVSTVAPLQEWAHNLPSTTKTNKELFQKLDAGMPITSLISNRDLVKESLAQAVNWALIEQKKELEEGLGNWKAIIKKAIDGMQPALRIKEIDEPDTSDDLQTVVIYPGRFQPMGRHHAATYDALVNKFGADNVFVATSDVVDPPKSPLNFAQKKDIMIKHGIPADKIVHTRNPYKADEILSNFDADSTVAIFAVGKKDMEESPRFANLDGVRKDGQPAYLRRLRSDEDLAPFGEHGYVDVAPHVEITIPGHGEMCGTSLRQCLQYADPEEFEKIMGWFDQETYDMLQKMLEESSGSGAGMGFSGGAWGYEVPATPGSEKPRKKRERRDFLKEEMVTEVLDYLLGITVG